MSNDEPSTEEPDPRIVQFWTMTQGYADVGDLDVVMGFNWSEALTPPAWRFGDSPETADGFAEMVLAGKRTAITSAHEDFAQAGEELPESGEVSILLDGSGEPKALLRSAEVLIMPFNAVTAEQALAEGDADSLEDWRAARRAAWDGDGALCDSSLVVWERFERLYPA